MTFTDANGDFVRDVLIIQTTTALGTDLPGLDDPNRLSSVNAPTLVRYTQVADSAKYYGFKALSAITVAGAYTVHVDSPYIAAVPVTQSQVTLTDQLAGLGDAVDRGSAGGEEDVPLTPALRLVPATEV